MGSGPAVEVTIGLGIPELVLLQPKHNAVDNQTAIIVAGKTITTTPDLDLGHILGEESIEQLFRIWSFELQWVFAGVQHRRFLPQPPVSVLRGMVIETTGHVATVINTVMRPLGPLDLVIGMPGQGIIPACPGHTGDQVSGLAIT